MNFLADLLGGLFGSIFKALLGDWTAKKAGANAQSVKDAQAVLQEKEAASVQVQQAVQAGDAASRSIDTPGGLRQYESTDPFNRDNH